MLPPRALHSVIVKYIFFKIVLVQKIKANTKIFKYLKKDLVWHLLVSSLWHLRGKIGSDQKILTYMNL